MTAFVVQDLAWAGLSAPAPASAVSAVPASSAASADALARVIADPSLLPIPPGQILLREWTAGTNGKLILHIQDAHGNYAAQKNLAESLAFWMDRFPSVQLVAVEGGEGDGTLDEFRRSAPAAVWHRAAPQLLRDGLVAGEEFLNLTSERPMRILGIEDQTLYDLDRAAYARIARERPHLVPALSQMRSAIEALKARMYPQAVLDYEAALRSGLRPDQPSDDWDFAARSAALRRLPESARPAMDRYPVWDAWEKLRAQEASSEDARLEAQMNALTSALPAEHPALELLRSGQANDPATVLSAWTSIEAAASARSDGTVQAGAELRRYLDRLRAVIRLDVEALGRDADAIDRDVYAAMLKDPASTRLREMDRYLRLLEQAVLLRLDGERTALLGTGMRAFPSRHLLAWLNRELADRGLEESWVGYDARVDASLRFVRKFYALAARRDEAFVKNLDAAMSGSDDTAAFLVAGGYHSSRILELLKARGYSAAVLTPVTDQETDWASYERVLLGKDFAHKAAGEVRSAAQSQLRQGLARLHLEARMAGSERPNLRELKKYLEDRGRMADAVSGQASGRAAQGTRGTRMADAVEMVQVIRSLEVVAEAMACGGLGLIGAWVIWKIWARRSGQVAKVTRVDEGGAAGVADGITVVGFEVLRREASPERIVDGLTRSGRWRGRTAMTLEYKGIAMSPGSRNWKHALIPRGDSGIVYFAPAAKGSGPTVSVRMAGIDPALGAVLAPGVLMLADDAYVALSPLLVDLIASGIKHPQITPEQYFHRFLVPLERMSPEFFKTLTTAKGRQGRGDLNDLLGRHQVNVHSATSLREEPAEVGLHLWNYAMAGVINGLDADGLQRFIKFKSDTRWSAHPLVYVRLAWRRFVSAPGSDDRKVLDRWFESAARVRKDVIRAAEDRFGPIADEAKDLTEPVELGLIASGKEKDIFAKADQLLKGGEYKWIAVNGLVTRPVDPNDPLGQVCDLLRSVASDPGAAREYHLSWVNELGVQKGDYDLRNTIAYIKQAGYHVPLLVISPRHAPRMSAASALFIRAASAADRSLTYLLTSRWFSRGFDRYVYRNYIAGFDVVFDGGSRIVGALAALFNPSAGGIKGARIEAGHVYFSGETGFWSGVLQESMRRAQIAERRNEAGRPDPGIYLAAAPMQLAQDPDRRSGELGWLAFYPDPSEASSADLDAIARHRLRFVGPTALEKLRPASIVIKARPGRRSSLYWIKPRDKFTIEVREPAAADAGRSSQIEKLLMSIAEDVPVRFLRDVTVSVQGPAPAEPVRHRLDRYRAAVKEREARARIAARAAARMTHSGAPDTPDSEPLIQSQGALPAFQAVPLIQMAVRGRYVDLVQDGQERPVVMVIDGDSAVGKTSFGRLFLDPVNRSVLLFPLDNFSNRHAYVSEDEDEVKAWARRIDARMRTRTAQGEAKRELIILEGFEMMKVARILEANHGWPIDIRVHLHADLATRKQNLLRRAAADADRAYEAANADRWLASTMQDYQFDVTYNFSLDNQIDSRVDLTRKIQIDVGRNAKAFRPVADRAASDIAARLPGGGVIVLDGMPSAGRGSFIGQMIMASLGYSTFESGERMIRQHAFLKSSEERLAVESRFREEYPEGTHNYTDEYRDFFDHQRAEDFIAPVLKFVGSQGDPDEVRVFDLPDAYNHVTKKAVPVRIRVQRGDWIILEGRYPLRLPSVLGYKNKVVIRTRVSDEFSEANHDVQTRLGYQDPQIIDNRRFFFRRGILPSAKRYMAQTETLVDFDLVQDDAENLSWVWRPARMAGAEALAGDPAARMSALGRVRRAFTTSGLVLGLAGFAGLVVAWWVGSWIAERIHPPLRFEKHGGLVDLLMRALPEHLNRDRRVRIAKRVVAVSWDERVTDENLRVATQFIERLKEEAGELFGKNIERSLEGQSGAFTDRSAEVDLRVDWDEIDWPVILADIRSAGPAGYGVEFHPAVDWRSVSKNGQITEFELGRQWVAIVPRDAARMTVRAERIREEDQLFRIGQIGADLAAVESKLDELIRQAEDRESVLAVMILREGEDPSLVWTRRPEQGFFENEGEYKTRERNRFKAVTDAVERSTGAADDDAPTQLVKIVIEKDRGNLNISIDPVRKFQGRSITHQLVRSMEKNFKGSSPDISPTISYYHSAPASPGTIEAFREVFRTVDGALERKVLSGEMPIGRYRDHVLYARPQRLLPSESQTGSLLAVEWESPYRMRRLSELLRTIRPRSGLERAILAPGEVAMIELAAGEHVYETLVGPLTAKNEMTRFAVQPADQQDLARTREYLARDGGRSDVLGEASYEAVFLQSARDGSKKTLGRRTVSGGYVETRVRLTPDLKLSVPPSGRGLTTSYPFPTSKPELFKVAGLGGRRFMIANPTAGPLALQISGEPMMVHALVGGDRPTALVLPSSVGKAADNADRSSRPRMAGKAWSITLKDLGKEGVRRLENVPPGAVEFAPPEPGRTEPLVSVTLNGSEPIVLPARLVRGRPNPYHGHLDHRVEIVYRGEAADRRGALKKARTMKIDGKVLLDAVPIPGGYRIKVGANRQDRSELEHQFHEITDDRLVSIRNLDAKSSESRSIGIADYSGLKQPSLKQRVRGLEPGKTIAVSLTLNRSMTLGEFLRNAMGRTDIFSRGKVYEVVSYNWLWLGSDGRTRDQSEEDNPVPNRYPGFADGDQPGVVPVRIDKGARIQLIVRLVDADDLKKWFAGSSAVRMAAVPPVGPSGGYQIEHYQHDGVASEALRDLLTWIELGHDEVAWMTDSGEEMRARLVVDRVNQSFNPQISDVVRIRVVPDGSFNEHPRYADVHRIMAAAIAKDDHVPAPGDFYQILLKSGVATVQTASRTQVIRPVIRIYQSQSSVGLGRVKQELRGRINEGRPAVLARIAAFADAAPARARKIIVIADSQNPTLDLRSEQNEYQTKVNYVDPYRKLGWKGPYTFAPERWTSFNAWVLPYPEDRVRVVDRIAPADLIRRMWEGVPDGQGLYGHLVFEPEGTLALVDAPETADRNIGHRSFFKEGLLNVYVHSGSAGGERVLPSGSHLQYILDPEPERGSPPHLNFVLTEKYPWLQEGYLRALIAAAESWRAVAHTLPSRARAMRINLDPEVDGMTELGLGAYPSLETLSEPQNLDRLRALLAGVRDRMRESMESAKSRPRMAQETSKPAAAGGTRREWLKRGAAVALGLAGLTAAWVASRRPAPPASVNPASGKRVPGEASSALDRAVRSVRDAVQWMENAGVSDESIRRYAADLDRAELNGPDQSSFYKTAPDGIRRILINPEHRLHRNVAQLAALDDPSAWILNYASAIAQEAEGYPLIAVAMEEVQKDFAEFKEIRKEIIRPVSGSYEFNYEAAEKHADLIERLVVFFWTGEWIESARRVEFLKRCHQLGLFSMEKAGEQATSMEAGLPASEVWWSNQFDRYKRYWDARENPDDLLAAVIGDQSVMGMQGRNPVVAAYLELTLRRLKKDPGAPVAAVEEIQRILQTGFRSEDPKSLLPVARQLGPRMRAAAERWRTRAAASAASSAPRMADAPQRVLARSMARLLVTVLSATDDQNVMIPLQRDGMLARVDAEPHMEMTGNFGLDSDYWEEVLMHEEFMSELPAFYKKMQLLGIDLSSEEFETTEEFDELSGVLRQTIEIGLGLEPAIQRMRGEKYDHSAFRASILKSIQNLPYLLAANRLIDREEMIPDPVSVHPDIPEDLWRSLVHGRGFGRLYHKNRSQLNAINAWKAIEPEVMKMIREHVGSDAHRTPESMKDAMQHLFTDDNGDYRRRRQERSDSMISRSTDRILGIREALNKYFMEHFEVEIKRDAMLHRSEEEIHVIWGEAIKQSESVLKEVGDAPDDDVFADRMVVATREIVDGLGNLLVNGTPSRATYYRGLHMFTMHTSTFYELMEKWIRIVYRVGPEPIFMDRVPIQHVAELTGLMTRHVEQISELSRQWGQDPNEQGQRLVGLASYLTAFWTLPHEYTNGIKGQRQVITMLDRFLDAWGGLRASLGDGYLSIQRSGINGTVVRKIRLLSTDEFRKRRSRDEYYRSVEVAVREMYWDANFDDVILQASRLTPVNQAADPQLTSQVQSGKDYDVARMADKAAAASVEPHELITRRIETLQEAWRKKALRSLPDVERATTKLVQAGGNERIVRMNERRVRYLKHMRSRLERLENAPFTPGPAEARIGLARRTRDGDAFWMHRLIEWWAVHLGDGSKAADDLKDLFMFETIDQRILDGLPEWTRRAAQREFRSAGTVSFARSVLRISRQRLELRLAKNPVVRAAWEEALALTANSRDDRKDISEAILRVAPRRHLRAITAKDIAGEAGAGWTSERVRLQRLKRGGLTAEAKKVLRFHGGRSHHWVNPDRVIRSARQVLDGGRKVTALSIAKQMMNEPLWAKDGDRPKSAEAVAASIPMIMMRQPERQRQLERIRRQSGNTRGQRVGNSSHARTAPARMAYRSMDQLSAAQRTELEDQARMAAPTVGKGVVPVAVDEGTYTLVPVDPETARMAVRQAASDRPALQATARTTADRPDPVQISQEMGAQTDEIEKTLTDAGVLQKAEGLKSAAETLAVAEVVFPLRVEGVESPAAEKMDEVRLQTVQFFIQAAERLGRQGIRLVADPDNSDPEMLKSLEQRHKDLTLRLNDHRIYVLKPETHTDRLDLNRKLYFFAEPTGYQEDGYGLMNVAGIGLVAGAIVIAASQAADRGTALIQEIHRVMPAWSMLASDDPTVEAGAVQLNPIVAYNLVTGVSDDPEQKKIYAAKSRRVGTRFADLLNVLRLAARMSALAA